MLCTCSYTYRNPKESPRFIFWGVYNRKNIWVIYQGAYIALSIRDSKGLLMIPMSLHYSRNNETDSRIFRDSRN